MNMPLTFSEGDVNLDGSDISLTFSLTAPFAFGYDGGASNPSEKVFLTNVPTIAVTASANVPTITAFESLLGFTSVSVGGSLALNVAINSVFHDPDSNSRLTMDEWASTALGDLVTVAFADATGNDIDGNLTLDASIIPGAPDASVVWHDASLADGPGTPTVTLNALDDFTNINASDIFGGLASATTALLSAQQNGDLQLPFLKESLSDLFHFADPLVSFIHELGDAAIVCGPNNTVPPSGPIFGLASGDTVYCRAYTINPVDLVDWKVGGTSSSTDVDTVGPNPSAAATLVLGTGGLDSVTLDFRFQGEADTTRLVPAALPHGGSTDRQAHQHRGHRHRHARLRCRQEDSDLPPTGGPPGRQQGGRNEFRRSVEGPDRALRPEPVGQRPDHHRGLRHRAGRDVWRHPGD